MRARRLFALLAAALVCVLFVVVVGRWEAARNARRQNAEMQAVLNKVGPLAAHLPTGFRIGPPDCLGYPLPDNALGLEVCFDSEGRVVETADRSGVQPRYASLQGQPYPAPAPQLRRRP